MRSWVVCMAIIAAATLLPWPAHAYVGPPMVVLDEGAPQGSNEHLERAVDDDPQSSARLAYRSGANRPGGWVVYSYEDGVARLWRRVTLSITGWAHVPEVTLYGPGMEVVRQFTVRAPSWTEELDPPLLVLAIRVQNIGANSLYIWDIQPELVEVEPPGVPAGLRVVQVTHERVRLAWDPPQSGGPVSAYRVYRDGVQLGTVDTTTYVDTDVTPLAEYRYEVSAVGPLEESARSEQVLVTIPEIPVIPPPAPPTALQVTPVVGGLRVSWSPSPSGEVIGYRVYLDGEQVLETPETAVTLANLEPGRTYLVSVTAITGDGRESSDATGSGEPLEEPTEPPGPVQDARARVNARTVTLLWNPPVSGGIATEYRVYRDGVLLGSTTETRWVDSGVEPEREYLYAIVALNHLGTSDPVEVPVSTPAPGLLEGANPGIPGLGGEVGAGLRLLLHPWLVAAGFILARVILTRGLRWVGVWRRG